VEPDRRPGVEGPVQRLNGTTIALIGALVLLVLMVAYLATRDNADQDKLTNSQVSGTSVTANEKACVSKRTYELIKRELFRRAAQLRGTDQAAYDRLSAYAVVRMENPVMETEDPSTHAVQCSGSLSIDLPPGVAVVGGRRTLASEIDYSVQPAADGSGAVVLLRNADAIITPLATLARVAPTVPPNPATTGDQTAPPIPQPTLPDPDAHSPVLLPQSAPTAEPLPPSRAPAARPSFNCANARTRGETAVCSDPGLASLDRQMASEFFRALSQADAGQREQLQRTRGRFLAFRDRCDSDACIADAYRGRMEEISDIMNR